ncbi:alpha-L-fucosidase [Globicatella sanguinis]
MKNKINEAIKVVPSKRQLNWQQLEFIGFIHFGINTFNDAEWGTGNEDISIFNPSELDAEQWVKALQSAGMKGLILTCKHHDGFCLWPSQYTNHTVSNTPYKNGKGDIVKEVSEACKKYGMKFGVYLSPWDMTDERYGTGKEYNDFFVNQLEELLTKYGEIFEVWFDGANGEGPNGKVQEYDWPRYYELIRKLQPNAVIAIMGPDVRWVGNEAGKVRENEWSVVPTMYSDPNYTENNSQKVDDGQFALKFELEDEDLGSREVIEKFDGNLIWYPAETDVSIRPGWFYHENEDDKVKTSEELFDIYKNSVGGNSLLLLNIPPNKKGLIANADLNELRFLGEKINQLNTDIELNYTLEVGDDISFNGINSNTNVQSSEMIVNFEKELSLKYLIIQEDITKSQRIEDLTIQLIDQDNNLHTKNIGTVGYKKIVDFENERKVKKIIIKINKYRGEKTYISTLKFV